MLAIHATSDAVARSLQAIATHSGLAPDPAAPHVLEEADGHIRLRHGDTVLHQLPCPARPDAIARMLAALHTGGMGLLQGGWQFDATARQLARPGAMLVLTEKESLLLAALLAAHPAACAREALLRDVWSMQPDIETHTLETHIYRLRHKLAELSPKPCDIVTSDGAYRLTTETDA